MTGSNTNGPGSGSESEAPRPKPGRPATETPGSGADATPSLEELRCLRELRPGTALPGGAGDEPFGREAPGPSEPDRETRIWPIPVFTLGMIALSLVLLPAIAFRLGGVPEGDVRAQGSAEVRSCARSVAYLGLAYACDALVTWESSPVIGGNDEAEPVERKVWSIEPLQGEVDVIERGAREEDHRVVPVDHPHRARLPTTMMPAYFVFGLVGFLIGLGTARRRSS